MKKFLVIVLFALFATATTTQAQDLFSIGPRAGINFSSPTDVNAGLSGSTGWNFGLSMELRPISLFSITVDAMYSKTSFTVSDLYSGIIEGNSYNIGYIDLPILANIYVFKGLHLKAGIQPSIKISEGGSWSGQLSDNIKNGAFAIPVGAGYTMNNGLNIDFRFNIATNKIADDCNIRNQQFVIGLGWRF